MGHLLDLLLAVRERISIESVQSGNAGVRCYRCGAASHDPRPSALRHYGGCTVALLDQALDEVMREGSK